MDDKALDTLLTRLCSDLVQFYQITTCDCCNSPVDFVAIEVNKDKEIQIHLRKHDGQQDSFIVGNWGEGGCAR